jgi:hypothetical protein
MYFPKIGRFQTKDTWQGNYNKPLSLNRWNYVEGNPVNVTDPTGHMPSQCALVNPRDWPKTPGCPGFIDSTQIRLDGDGWPKIPPSCPLDTIVMSPGATQYDLTGYLALAMSRHGVDPRVKEIAGMLVASSYITYIHDVASKVLWLGAYVKFNELEGGDKEWDIKVKIKRDLREGVVLCGATCEWFDYSTPGNIHFGYVAYRANIDHGVAAIAGGALEQKDSIWNQNRIYPEYCQQNASILYCDNPEDQAAVDFGYDLAEKYPNGLTEIDLRSELTASVMAKFQHPKFGIVFPHPAYSEFNDYSADHFNN